MIKMNKEEKKLKLLTPDQFSDADPKNPKNINIEKKLEEARRKRADELAKKIIIINGKKQK